MRLGRYELVRRLARGDLTELWLARITGAADFERFVIVKQIREDRARDQVFVQSFMTEARVAGALHHHNIVQVQDIGDDGGHHYLAMEYVHGESLRGVLARLHERQQQMPLQHVFAIIGAVASALHYAHELRGSDKLPAGIVHRAITPGNILVGYDGNVKVIDFGITKAALRTAEGTLLGSKVPYMAPEECTGQLVDRRADVFALGVVLHEAVTGRRLFKAETEFLTMSAIAHGIVPRASHYRKDLPPPLEAVITKALARIPAERYQTADELRLALEPIATKHATGMMPSALAAYMKQLFDGRPEPWHDTKELVSAPIDFDGQASGLAVPPADAIAAYALPTGTANVSPLTQARTRAITNTPTSKIDAVPIRAGLRQVVPLKPPPRQVGEFTEVDVKPPPAAEPPAAASVDIAAAREATAVVAPLPRLRSSRLGRNKRLLWLAASALVASAGVIAFLSMTAPPTKLSPATPVVHDSEHAKPAPPKEPPPKQEEPAAIPWEKRTWANTEAAKAATPPPAPEPPPAPVPQPKEEPAPPPKAEPPPPEPAPEPKAEPKAEPAPEPQHVAEPTPKPEHHKPAAKPAAKPVAKKPATKPTPKPKDWDPDSLFYEKKP